MRATGQAKSLDRHSRGIRAPAGRGPRHPRRMAGRLRRRLAGLRRCLAGDQADRRVARGGGRSRVRRQPRSVAAATHGPRSRSRFSDRSKAARGQPRSRPRRHGPERRPDPRDGDREVPASRRAGMERPTGRALASSTRSPRPCPAVTSRRSGERRHETSSGPIQTIIPAATNAFTERLIARRRDHFGGGFLGLLDARRHVRRRHGLHRRSPSQGGGPVIPARGNGSAAKPVPEQPALRDGAGRIRLRRQPERHDCGVPFIRRRSVAARILRARRCPAGFARTRAA